MQTRMVNKGTRIETILIENMMRQVQIYYELCVK